MKKYFLLKNYRFRYLALLKKLKIYYLSNKKLTIIPISYFDFPITRVESNEKNIDLDQYNILGTFINLDKIDWHKDEVADFEYPNSRLDKLKISQYFNKGIDFLIPWVKSRFHFLFSLAAAYNETGDIVHYQKFKTLILDWEKNNPFLYGILWYPPMDLSIGSVNLILSINIFSKLIKKDELFEKKLSEMLVKRGEYLEKFIEVYDDQHTTNHTTTDYAGLFFLSISLKNHPQSQLWQYTAVKGIIDCMDYQVNDDGGAFECSISYHRLVLEIFGLFTVFAIYNKIKLPENFLIKLFKMFQFTASYLDQKGNAPKFGDCDSGRFVIMDKLTSFDFYESENNHKYLLNFGEHIFNYTFTQDSDNKFKFGSYLPKNKLIEPADLIPDTLNYQNSIPFYETGLFNLKNRQIDLSVVGYPLGQNGRGGHNHYDFGSFTLSVNGNPFIVDPGEFQYTRDKNERIKFRSYPYHNTLSNKWDLNNLNRENEGHFKWWGIHDLYSSKIKYFKENELEIDINRIEDQLTRTRKFEIKENYFKLTDNYQNEFISNFNFHPNVKILKIEEGRIVTNLCEMKFIKFDKFKIESYDFAPYYGKKVLSKSLKIFAQQSLEVQFLIS